MKCVLNPKKLKHRLCEEIAGRKYTRCYVRGGWAHNIVQCAFNDPPYGNFDFIDLRARTVTPEIRHGVFVSQPSSQASQSPDAQGVQSLTPETRKRDC